LRDAAVIHDVFNLNHNKGSQIKSNHVQAFKSSCNMEYAKGMLDA